MKHKKSENKQQAFTLVEMVIGIGIFMVLAVAVIGAYAALTSTIKAARLKVITSSLAAEQLEVVRNLPYSDVGTISGNPNGSLPDQVNPTQVSREGVDFDIYYEVTFLDDPADGTILAGTDANPADYKQVKMFVFNTLTSQTATFITNISPKGLEAMGIGGALSIVVFNATGQPVPGTTVSITNALLNPTISLSRTTDNAGRVLEVGLPASVNGYHITATKTGYTSDQTYPITQQNPNPINPDATVAVGVVTAVSLQIDLVSTLNLRTLDKVCQPVNGVGVNVKGAKLVGTNPDVLKFNQNFTSAGGLITLSNLEWDTYYPTLIPGQGYLLRGTSPVQEVTVLPNTTHTFTMIIDDAGTGYSLLVLVKDSATGAAIQGAKIRLQKGGSQPQDYEGETGGSTWVQRDWTEGSGQANWIEEDEYFEDDGNVDINSVPTGVRLKKVTGRYVASGWLVSSSFDTGSGDSDFTSLVWDPTSQDPAAVLKFQIATNNDNATWNFLGPDGTANTYYTVSGTTINSVHDNNRYIRYKAYLSTGNDKKTPVLTNLTTNYVSGCYTPGQFAFINLTQGQNYDITVTAPGYQTFQQNSLNITGQDLFEVLMSP